MAFKTRQVINELISFTKIPYGLNWNLNVF